MHHARLLLSGNGVDEAVVKVPKYAIHEIRHATSFAGTSMSINPEEIMRLMKQLKQWMAVASIGLMAFSVAASPTEPVEGVEYQRLQTPQPQSLIHI